MKRHTSTYSAGSVDLPWQQGGMDIEPLASVTTNPTPKQSLKNTGQMCRATKTSAKYEASYTQESLFSQGGFHVKTLATQSPGQAKGSLHQMELKDKEVDYGLKCKGLSRKQGQSLWSQKMSRHSRTKDSTSFYNRLPTSGTMRNGKLFQPLCLAHPISGKGFGLWLTPSASDGSKRASFLAKSLAKRFDVHPNGNLAEQYAKLTGKRLCPNLLEFMMGYKKNHTMLNELDAWEMPSSRRSQRKSSDASTK